jgi:hypothetical protein
MQMCQKHWDLLRAEIAKKGLDKFVANSADELHQRIIETGDAGIDPLLMSNTMLIMAAVEVLGVGSMAEEICPLCAVEQCENAPEKVAEEWLDGCTTAVYNVYKEEGRFGRAQ